MNLQSIVDNKWFKYVKYMLTSLTILFCIISLVAAWYAGGGANRDPGGDPAGAINDVTKYHEGLRIACLVFGFLGILVAVINFANNKNPVIVLIAFVFLVGFLITLISISSLSFLTTTYLPSS